jgi:death-on-curing protein
VVALADREVGSEPAVDMALLEKVMARPCEAAEGHDTFPGVHLKGAVLFSELLLRRPFAHDNARIALLATIVFFNLNEYEVEADATDLVDLTRLTSRDQLSVLTVAAAFEAATVRMRAADEEG